ncbi:MAG: hypothetical protein R3B57_01040 [Phycisphaerales bacterium]
MTRLRAFSCLVGASGALVLAGCGVRFTPSCEIDVALPNGYRLVSISASRGCTAFIVNGRGSTVVPAGAGWSVSEYAVSGETIVGTILGKRSGQTAYFSLDTASGQELEFTTEDAWREHWAQTHTDEIPELYPWDNQPPSP